MGIHSDAAAALLPYHANATSTCWWVAQWMLTLRAMVLFRGHVLLLQSVRVRNVKHGSYPRKGCMEDMARTTAEMRRGSPNHIRSCFLENTKRTSYHPWSLAKRKGQAIYRNMTFAAVQSCDVDLGSRGRSLIEANNPDVSPNSLAAHGRTLMSALEGMSHHRPNF